MKKIKYKHQLSQSYWAGCLTAKLYNTYYTRSDLPSIVRCMRDFYMLRTIFGKYYNLLKSNKHCNPYIEKYEEYDKLDLNQSLIGDYTDFMIGYSDIIKKNKL